MSNSTVEPEEQSPWTQRGFIVSAVVVALILVLAVVLLLTRPSDDGTATPPPEAATPSASTSPTDLEASTCGLPAGDQAVPSSAPVATQWELVGTVAVPAAPDSYGPGEVVDGLRTCFARSPLGALYAASNIVASTSVPELREPVVQQLGVNSPGRDRALEALEAGGAGTSAGGGVQIAGFTFLNYDESGAVVDLALRAAGDDGQSGFVHAPVTLRWEEGDWKVVFAPDGSLGAGIGPIPDLTGYVPWSGA